jgi:exo-poly-alpha-galacturonosidase
VHRVGFGLVALALTLLSPQAHAATTTQLSAAVVTVQPPTNVRVPTLAYDESSITLTWQKPSNHAAIVDYRVYSDGVLLGRASDGRTSPAKPYIDAFYADPANAGQVKIVMSTFTATGLRPSTTYRFTVRSVDANGAESVDSPVVTQATTAVPQIFDVTRYGAVGDGTTVNTKAIQAAIDACTPGGKVLIPAGVFVTGAIWLKSNMTLEVAQGATLLGSANADDYPYNFLLYEYSTDKRFYSMINAHTYDYGSLTNIRIVGKGIIDGNGWKQNGVDAEGFPVSAPSSSSTVSTNGILAKAQVAKAAALGSPSPYPTRSNLITLRGVTNVYYGGFTARNPSNHTIVNLHDKNVTVNGVRLETYDVNNADGIEFGNSDGLQVFNTVFDNGDDCMNFAAGLGAASESDQPSGNAWIANNYFRNGHGAVVAGSHTGAWIQNITAEDNVINGTDVGLRMKTDPNNGGGARNITFRDNAMKNLNNEAFIFTSGYSDPNAAIVVEPAARKSQFVNVYVEHVSVDGTGGAAIKVVGVPGQYHDNLHFRDVHFLKAKPTSIQYLSNSSFDDVVFDATPNPWVISKSTGLTFAGSTPTNAVTTDAATGPIWPATSTLTATPTDNSVTLTWPAATDNVAVADYQIYDGTTLLATVPGTTLSSLLTGLPPVHTFAFRVVAEDATGNSASGPVTSATTTGTPDTVAPVAPLDNPAITLNAASVGGTWAKLAWKPATDNYGVARYDIAANGKLIATLGGNVLTFTATRLTPGTPYVFSVTAVDAAGNATPYGSTLALTTAPAYDRGAPTWPSGASVRAVSIGAASVVLAWTAATDDMGVTGYRVYRDGTPLPAGATFTPISTTSTVNTTAYVVTGLKPNTTYTFRVEAGDAVGRWSGRGPSIKVTTKP